MKKKVTVKKTTSKKTAPKKKAPSKLEIIMMAKMGRGEKMEHMGKKGKC